MTSPPYFADARAIARHYNVAVGTVHYWVSLYKVSSVPDPDEPRRRRYSLLEFDQAARSQELKRAARHTSKENHDQPAA